MNATEELEFKNCQIGSFAKALTMEIKQQIIEQRESQAVFGEKSTALFDEIQRTISEIHKAKAAARRNRKPRFSNEELEDMGGGCYTIDGFIKF